MSAWNAAEAASLGERIAKLVTPIDLDPSDDEPRELQRTWQALVADGVEERFARRLDALGETPASITRLLGPVGPAAEDLPWDRAVASLLEEVAAVEGNDDGASVDAVADPTVPFVDLLAPLVEVGSRRLRRRLSSTRAVSTGAWQQLELQLARRLARLSEPTLLLEFAIFRGQHRSSVERIIQLARPGDDRFYRRFIGRPRSERLTALVRRYPVLARCWAQLVGDWVDLNEEFLRRLATDADALARLVGAPAGLPSVESIICDLSDHHHGGRTVYRVKFMGAGEAMYKPRNIDIEARWSALLEWLGQRGAPVELTGLAVVARPDHGWVEVARAEACANTDEFPEFYRRSGALLALVYLLAGNDCHRENLIAVGNRPVLVDVETLMHPGTSPRPEPLDDANAKLIRSLQHSVLGTALLPHWSPMPSGGGYDSGGIGPGGTLSMHVQARLPHLRNTDEAGYAERRVSVLPAQNVPRTDRELAVVDQYLDAIVEGFTAMAEFVATVRDDLLAGPVAAFAGVRVRVLMRATSAYEDIRSRSLQPRAMRRGAARSVIIDRLVRPLLHSESVGDAAAWSSVDQERQALEVLDIPRFEVKSDETASGWRTGWTHSGFALARTRIAELDASTIARQVDLIRASFDVRGSVVQVARPAREPAVDSPAITDAQLHDVIGRIVRRTAELATLGHGQTATWSTLEVIEDSLAYKLKPMGPGLYNGTAGVGLFLAAAAAIVDDDDARQLAWAAVRSLRLALHDAGMGSSPVTSIGGVMGLPSAAYALAWMGRLLEDDTLVADAARILAMIDVRAIEADRRFDVAGGAAGAILVLLAVHSLQPDPQLVELARACGEHLLRHRSGKPATWTTPSGLRLAGLAHGASGFASALERLSDATDDPRFRDAARDALAFERTLFVSEVGNWRDVRPDVVGPSFMTSWCNGACGIGMARLCHHRAPLAAEELSIAIATSTREAFGSIDHFCCGNAGRADFLLEAGYRLGLSAARRSSRQVLAAMLERADRRGTWALSPHSHAGSEHPGLFRGLGGIAWVCLRHLAPERLPAIGSLDGARPGL